MSYYIGLPLSALITGFVITATNYALKQKKIDDMCGEKVINWRLNHTNSLSYDIVDLRNKQSPKTLTAEQQAEQKEYDEQVKMSNACRKKKEALTAKNSKNKSYVYIIVGILLILIATMVNVESIQLGLGFAGVYLIMYTICNQWRKLGERERLMLYGGSIVILSYYAYLVYKNKSLVNPFDLSIFK